MAEAPAGSAVDSARRPRAVFLGTSLTAGFGLTRDRERFTDRLQARADSAGIDVDIVNAGQSGDTSAGGLRRLDWILREPLDVLVVELGANDGLRGLSVAALEENLRQIVRRTRARYPDATVILASMEAPPNLGESYTRAFREVFARVSEAEGAELLPFLLEDVAGDPALNQPDRIHPNAEGHARIAEKIWPVLAPLLREATR